MRRRLRAPSPSKAGLCGKVAWRVRPVDSCATSEPSSGLRHSALTAAMILSECAGSCPLFGLGSRFQSGQRSARTHRADWVPRLRSSRPAVRRHRVAVIVKQAEVDGSRAVSR